MTVEIEYGYAAGQQYEVCAHVVGAERMVCGRRIASITVSIGTPGERFHARCRDLLAAGVTAPPARGSGCPVCGESAPVVDGRIGPHGAGCVGVNLPAKQGRP